MAGLLQILFTCLAVFLLTGCADNQQQAVIEGIKLSDLAATGPGAQSKILRTTNIDVFGFELHTDKLESLDELWQVLNADSLRYNNPKGFVLNGLRAARGDFSSLDKAIELLNAAGANKLSTTSLLVMHGKAEVLRIGRINRRTTISYIRRPGTVETAEVGPATLGLQVSARQISGDRPLANVQVVPVISHSTEGLTPQLAQRLKASDVYFYSAGFSAILKPGDFMVVAPARYEQDETTAAGRFFTKSGPNPTIRVLLLFCTSIL